MWRDVHDQVLDADAPLAVEVVAGLVADYHARLEARLVERNARADAHRRLVYVQKVAHAVARAVAVLEVVAPARRACKRINHIARRVVREDEAVNGNVALQHPRKAPALLGGRCAKVQRARHIRGAKGEVRTAVAQVERVAVDRGAALLGRRVVNDGAVRAGGRDRREAQTLELGLLLAELGKLVRALCLGDGVAALQRLLKPREVGHERRAVAQMCLAETVLLHEVLDALRIHHKRAAHHRTLCAKRLENGVGGALADQHLLARLQLRLHRAQVIVKGRIGAHDHRRAQVLAHVCRELCIVHIEYGAVHGHDRKRKEHGVVWHILAPQVKEPRDLVEHGRNEPVRADALQLLAQVLDLLVKRTAGDRVGQREDLLLRTLGAVVPHLRNEVVRKRHKLHVARLQVADELLRLLDANYLGVDADPRVHRETRDEPLLPRRHLGLAHLHQRPHARLELLRRLQEVAAIGKEQRIVVREQRRASGTVEARDVAAQQIGHGRILTRVLVLRRDEVCVEVVLLHASTHLLDNRLGGHHAVVHSAHRDRRGRSERRKVGDST